MSVAYLLDTDICSYFLRNRYGILRKFQEVGSETLFVSRITWAELMVLAVRRKFGKITRESVEELLDTTVFVEVDEVAWNLFPDIKAGLYKGGKPIGDSGNLDILQACVAVTRGLTLVSHNRRHYQAIAEQIPLTLEDWTEGQDP